MDRLLAQMLPHSKQGKGFNYAKLTNMGVTVMDAGLVGLKKYL
jgi:ribosomal protein L13E